MRSRELRLVAAPFALALALAAADAKPAEVKNLGDRIGAAVKRGAQATGRAAERAGSSTGAAAGRSLGWAQRKMRGERGAKPNRER